VTSEYAYDAVVIGGGRSGLAAAHHITGQGVSTAILEASGEATGSWPRYYDSLTLFSPARYSALPGRAFPGDPDRYPHRDEVIDYLRSYAAAWDADIHTSTPVEAVTSIGSDGFTVTTKSGPVFTAPRRRTRRAGAAGTRPTWSGACGRRQHAAGRTRDDHRPAGQPGRVF
jgi:putative flavoprotein involved in K+ transport